MLKGGSMAEKRIDYNAPLLSVRRFHSAISSESKARGKSSPAAPPPPPQPQPPAYKSELKSGPVRNPGSVPFTWEDAPGCPKEDSPPPPPPPPPPSPPPDLEKLEEDDGGKVEKPSDAEEKTGEEGEEDAFSDALETLSRADSCFMNCSISGTTGGVPAMIGDPQAREFMMGRFLPAAQAVATGSPHVAPVRKTAGPVDSGRDIRRVPQQSYRSRTRPMPPYLQQRLPAEESGGSDDEEEEDDWDNCSTAGQLQMRGCGFLPRFCLKGSMRLMNPVPGMKAKDTGTLPPARKRSPAVKTVSNPGFVGKAGREQTWEAVYMHKQGGGHPMQLEDVSKVTSESNHLTYWSDSMSPDGSSPYRRSTGGGSLSPYQNGTPRSSFQEGKGLLGFPKEVGSVARADSTGSGSRGSEKYIEIQPHLLGEGVLGSSSPTVVKSGSYVNSDIQGSPKVLRFAEARESPDINDEHFEVSMENGRVDGNVGMEGHEVNAMPSESDANDGLVAAELDDHGECDYDINLQLPLPPPLPKSPSESWLSRALPSVSSKNQAPLSFLGMKFLAKKNGDQISSANPKWEAVVKGTNANNGQLRFSEILANPIKEEG